MPVVSAISVNNLHYLFIHIYKILLYSACYIWYVICKYSYVLNEIRSI
ncbi:hypothetical protein P3J6_120603 [Pseudoalteromonas sp. 3J6]|nr:hypothetical protein P3J6_120603 [Pseudoalteromonas sp. 3J6]